ncbi:MAG: hypothetical protein U9O87_00865 [Verrucomicrobiota bacterium]|nr:hypothetical protein [Verrucomicrobiota bacterium]
MLSKDKKQFIVSQNNWKSIHSRKQFAGPEFYLSSKTPLVSNISTYLDNLKNNAAIIKTSKGNMKSGQAILREDAYWKPAPHADLANTYKYGKNHVRLTTDISLKKGTSIKRHFGVGSLTLNGKWVRFYCIPPALHQAEGCTPEWHDIVDFADSAKVDSKKYKELEGLPPIMIAHWHRPPLAIVFERHDGTLLEVGIGDDIYRWEKSLSTIPESGSYKLMLYHNKIHFIREPLMTCETISPEPRDYRFQSYFAWKHIDETEKIKPEKTLTISLQKGIQKNYITSEKTLICPDIIIDFAKNNFDSHFYRTQSSLDYVRKNRSASPCWKHRGVQKQYKLLMRQLNMLEGIKSIGFLNLTPGVCTDPSHINKKNKNGLYHWDINSILEFIEWSRNLWKDDTVLYTVKGNNKFILPSLEI